MIKREEYKVSKIVLPGCPKRECQVLEEETEKADDGDEKKVAPCVEMKG